MVGLQIPHFGLQRQYSNLKAELLFATDQVLRSGCLVGGPYTNKFEQWLKDYTGAQYALTVHSGTQALEIIARFHYLQNDPFDFNIKPKIYIPNVSYPATLNAFINTGWDIELCDTDSNGLLNASNTDSLTYKCFVGLYGAPQTYDIPSEVIVDGAQHWLVADGNFGEGMAVSFDPTKNLNASGNGGAIVTNNHELYEYAKRYRDNDKGYNEYVGTNSKLSEQDASHLLVRAQHISAWQRRREVTRLYYLDQFKNIPIKCLSAGFRTHADQKFVVYTEQRDHLKQYLTSKGVETKIHYERALSELPIAMPYIKPTMLATSVFLTRGVLSLPIYPELTDGEIEYIVQSVLEFFAK